MGGSSTAGISAGLIGGTAGSAPPSGALVVSDLARRPINGVHLLAAAVADTIQTRLEVLRLTVIEGCVVVDRPAG